MQPEHEAMVVALLLDAMEKPHDPGSATVDLKDFDYVPAMLKVNGKMCHLMSVHRALTRNRLTCTYWWSE
jgi:hypothetical protein